jgi:UDP-glucose 4-epimerase
MSSVSGGNDPRSRPPVLVTGGAGYIGGHFVLALLDSGERVVVIDNFSTVPRRELPEGVLLVVGDAGDTDLVRRVVREHGIREIAHFAARIVVPESVSDPLSYYLANTVTTRALLQAAVDEGMERIVFSSTAAVYGNARANPIAEDAALDPLSPYGTSKLMSEWMLRDAARAHGFSYAALRYFNVAGADPDGRSGQMVRNATHLVKVAVQTALGLRDELTVYGTDYGTPDGTCVRDYIHVSDLAEAHVAVLRQLRARSDTLVLNCGYGRGNSVLQVIEAVKRASGVDFPVVLGPRRPGDPDALVADVSRIRQVVDWQPRFDDLDTIVRSALAWERSLLESKPR